MSSVLSKTVAVEKRFLFDSSVLISHQRQHQPLEICFVKERAAENNHLSSLKNKQKLNGKSFETVFFFVHGGSRYINFVLHCYSCLIGVRLQTLSKFLNVDVELFLLVIVKSYLSSNCPLTSTLKVHPPVQSPLSL